MDSVQETIGFARMLETAGCKVLCVHGRSLAQEGGGLASWTTLAAVRAAVGIPVIANGNILTLTCAKKGLAATGT